MLLIFGAEVNPLNNHCQTPLDLAISIESCNTVAMLISVDGKTGDALLSEEDGPATIWKLEPFNQVGENVIHRGGSSCDRCGLFITTTALSGYFSTTALLPTVLLV